MEGLCILFPIFFLAMTIGLVCAAVVDGRENRERWGAVLATVRRGGDGAYRETSLTEHRLRGVPVTVWISGVVSAVLAPFTGLVCAPLGLLGGVILGATRGGEAIVGAVTVLVAFSGLALPFGLWHSARGLMTCAVDAPKTAVNVGVWSLVHHVVIGVAWSLPLVTAPLDARLWAVVPAAFGAVHAVVTIAAGRVTRQAQDRLSPEEQAALPPG